VSYSGACTASATLAVAANSSHRFAFEDEFGDREALPDFDTGFGRRIHQQGVENGPARAKASLAAIGVGYRADQREGADIEPHPPANRRQPGCGQSLQQPPFLQDFGAVGPDDVG
jgi:hypothetical protein